MCVFFEFLVFIADLLLLGFLLEFEVVVVSQRRIVFVSEPCLGVAKRWGRCLDPWEMPQQEKKKKAWMEMRRMFEEEREFGVKMRN